jgi:HD-like signal output (HDOD) protein
LEFKDLVKLAEGDAVLAGRVLALANSGAYGRRRNVDSIQYAIAFIGVSAIRRNAVSWAMGSVFRHFHPAESAAWSTTRFMAHSEHTATLCDMFCDRFPVREAEAAYMAGLTHDIGKLVMAMANRDAPGEVLDFMRLTGTPMVEAERELLGIGHPEISGMAAERWHLPDAICDAVYRHHNPEPDDKSAAPLSLVVAHADRVVNSIGFGIVPETPAKFEMCWPGRESAARAALDSFRLTLMPANGTSTQQGDLMMELAT